MAPEGAMQVIGGNWQIFQRMIQESGAHEIPSTAVTSLSRDTQVISHPAYVIKTKAQPSKESEVPENVEETYPVTADFLSMIFGTNISESVVGSQGPDGTEVISWFYPHVFNSYPIAYPRFTFQDPIVGAGLYYTSGMVSFISTMETNALMGM